MPSVVRIHLRPLHNQIIITFCGSSSVDRASAFQAEGRGFEPRLPLFFLPCHIRHAVPEGDVHEQSCCHADLRCGCFFPVDVAFESFWISGQGWLTPKPRLIRGVSPDILCEGNFLDTFI